MLRNSSTILFSFRKYCCNSMIKTKEKIKSIGEGNISVQLNNNTGIATITIDQENKKNAISGKMMIDFENAVEELEKWKDGKAVLLKSKGDFFCSGADLSTVRSLISPEEGTLMSSHMQNVTSRIGNLPLVSFSLIDGPALGGGAELCTCTDFRIFTDKGEIAFLQSKMALSPGWGGGTRLTQLIGKSLALTLLLSCKKVKHQEALQIGLADFVISSENSLELASELIKNLVKHNKEVVRGMKSVVVGAKCLNTSDSLTNENKIFSTLWGKPANIEMVNKAMKHN